MAGNGYLGSFCGATSYGNKRSAAIYELARADVVIRAFLIGARPGYPPLAMP